MSFLRLCTVSFLSMSLLAPAGMAMGDAPDKPDDPPKDVNLGFNPKGPINGVDLYHLDRVAFRGWLAKLHKPMWNERVNNLLDELKASGVTWVRYHTRPTWQRIFPESVDSEPTEKMIEFAASINLLNSMLKERGFGVEVMIGSRHNLENAKDYGEYPYTIQKVFYRQLLGLLDHDKIDLFMMGGDHNITQWPGDQWVNARRWVNHMMPWMHKKFPNLPISYEVTGLAISSRVKTEMSFLNEAQENTKNPVFSISYYPHKTEEPGTPIETHRARIREALANYEEHRNDKTPMLWIDEYGFPNCDFAGIDEKYVPHKPDDQKRFLRAFLEETKGYPRFLWEMGRSNQTPPKCTFTMIEHWDGNKPVMNDLWDIIKEHYLADLAEAAEGTKRPNVKEAGITRKFQPWAVWIKPEERLTDIKVHVYHADGTPWFKVNRNQDPEKDFISFRLKENTEDFSVVLEDLTDGSRGKAWISGDALPPAN